MGRIADNPVIVLITVLGGIASIIGLCVLFGPPGKVERQPQEMPERVPQGNPRAEAQIKILEQKYNSQENLLLKVKVAEEDIADATRQMASLQEEQRALYSEKTFAGSEQLRQWRAEVSRLRAMLQEAERRRDALQSDYEAWLRHASELTR